jgi:lipopolysaccharide/colanic/teichoic acid biosynthesis glycosyltransferase
VPPESLVEGPARPTREDGGARRVDPILRGLDIVLATLVFALALPLAACVSLAILVTSGRPVLYRGARVGRDGRIFTMLKLRTLKPDAESRLGPYWGAELDRRTGAEVTRLGRWLRASQLDELPQLVNVIRGDMSIVGPRPVRPALLEALSRDIPQYWQRLTVRPGLSGFAQTRLGRELSWQEKLAHDLEYVADRSIGLYLHVVAVTTWRVVRQSAREVVSLAATAVTHAVRRRADPDT